MKIVTAAEMREIDRTTIEEYGIPSLVLMERAGLAVAAKVKEVCAGRKVLVLCGSGNNGGDGLVAARRLYNEGYRVKVIMLGKAASFSSDCKTQYLTAKKTGIPIEIRKSLDSIDLHGAFVIDAIFGTGLSRPVTGDLTALFRSLNKAEVPVLSVDMPSGISSDTGEILGEAIKADHTVTFGLPKRGHYLYPGAEYAGGLCVEDIGFPAKLIRSNALRTELMEQERAVFLIPERPRNSYKGDYGHVFVLAGSRGRTGAALMTAKACLRTGSGLLTLGVPESLVDIFQGRVTEEMTLPLPDKGNGTLDDKAIESILGFASQNADIIAIGPGIGVSPDTERIVSRLVQTSPVPMVIDADGLNSLKNSIKILRNAKSPIIITPHPGEMVRLLNHKSEAGSQQSGLRTKIEKERITTAVSFSQETGVYVVLKGVPTIVAAPEGDVYINTTGNPGMATAGSGDVLTGIISSLAGQGLTPLNAAALGVYLHGRAGDEAAKVKGEHSLIASDIIEYLSDTIRSMA
jgi:NAD(P)H-hydrate epimerase